MPRPGPINNGDRLGLEASRRALMGEEEQPSPMMEQEEQAAAAESEAAQREQVIPVEVGTGGVDIEEELERKGLLTNETLRDWVKRWCGGDHEGLPHISTWITSKVTDMSRLFKTQVEFNDDISAWDTSSVMPHISTWNTCRVTDMSLLFCRWQEKFLHGSNQRQNGLRNKRNIMLPASASSSFDDDISAWDTSSVTRMDYMFMDQSAFNHPLNDWRVDNVTNMSYMFYGARSFNQPLGDWRLRSDCRTNRMFDEAFRNSRPLRRPVKESCCSIS